MQERSREAKERERVWSWILDLFDGTPDPWPEISLKEWQRYYGYVPCCDNPDSQPDEEWMARCANCGKVAPIIAFAGSAR